MSTPVAVRPLEAAEFERYDRFVASRRDATPYHGRAWHGLLAQAFGYEPRVLVAWRGAEVAGAWPLALVCTRLGGRRLVALPFSHHLPPLADDAECLAALLGATEELALAERCRFIELRSGVLAAAPRGWTAVTSYVTTAMPLEGDDEAQLGRLRANTRQQLLQGLRQAELRVEQREDDAALECFASLVALTRRRKGSLTYPRAFYRELAERFIRPGAARLDVATVAGRCVAALLTFCAGPVAVYGYSGSVEDPEVLRLRPINVLMWRGITWARARGARVFDFGTSLPTQTGLIWFKEGWGGTTSPLPYYVWVRPSRRARAVVQDGVAARLASHLLRRLPQPLFTRVTPYLLRQLG